MGRARRVDIGNIPYHVINRGNFRSQLFDNEKEYRAFMKIIEETLEAVPMHIIAYCLMPNHWHMILFPEHDGDLSKFMQRISLTHTQRYHTRTETQGYGHIYQGRYKSFPIQNNEYFLNAVRYVERNAERAGLVDRAENWPWSSAHLRTGGQLSPSLSSPLLSTAPLLSPWPIEAPDDYLAWLYQNQSPEEIDAIHTAIAKNRPYGSSEWTGDMVKKFGLEQSLRDRGRPPAPEGNGT